jgi:hypothetical protein
LRVGGRQVDDDPARLAQPAHGRADEIDQRFGAGRELHLQDSAGDQEADFQGVGARLGGQAFGGGAQKIDRGRSPFRELRGQLLRFCHRGGGARLSPSSESGMVLAMTVG